MAVKLRAGVVVPGAAASVGAVVPGVAVKRRAGVIVPAAAASVGAVVEPSQRDDILGAQLTVGLQPGDQILDSHPCLCRRLVTAGAGGAVRHGTSDPLFDQPYHDIPRNAICFRTGNLPSTLSSS